MTLHDLLLKRGFAVPSASLPAEQILRPVDAPEAGLALGRIAPGMVAIMWPVTDPDAPKASRRQALRAALQEAINRASIEHAQLITFSATPPVEDLLKEAGFTLAEPTNLYVRNS